MSAAKVAFRGGWTCSCVADSLPLVELVMLTRGLINESIDIMQLGWRDDVAASASTHARGGCTDVGQYSAAQIDVWRWAGWTMQHRTPAQGFDHHAHGWPWGCSHLAPGAQGQATQWGNRQNGLVSRGRIDGTWPVVDFRTGLRRMEKELTQFADDIVARTAKAVSADLAGLPRAVWRKDGTVPNEGFTSNTANPDIAASTAFVETFREIQAVRKRQAETDAKLDAILAKLDKPVA